MTELNKIHQQNALQRWPYPDKWFHTIVTSPPYYGLRDYGVDGQVGLEETPEEFIQNLVQIFREAWRTLRDDGTLWVNIGDSYWGGKGKSGCQDPEKAEKRNAAGLALTKKWQQLGGYEKIRPTDRKHANIKAKDLIGIPWMLAFALRSDGWYLRQDIIWNKPNPMPESIDDRCTKAHEYIFLLSKSRTYFFDGHAIATPAKYDSHKRGAKKNDLQGKTADAWNPAFRSIQEVAKKRSVWTIATIPFSEAHFATFPEELPTYCIRAGSSEKGCCSECGAPYKRQVKPSEAYAATLGKSYHDHSQDKEIGNTQNRGRSQQQEMAKNGVFTAEYVTVGWNASCACSGGGRQRCTLPGGRTLLRRRNDALGSQEAGAELWGSGIEPCLY